MTIAKFFNNFLIIIVCLFISYASSTRNLNADNRNDTGIYNSYYVCIEEQSDSICSHIISAPNYEILLWAAMKLQIFLFNDFQFFLFIISLFFTFSILFFYRSVTSYVFPCFFLLLIYPMYLEALTNTIRQTLCIGIGLFFLGYYINNFDMHGKKKLLFYASFITCMFLSHSMGIVFYIGILFAVALFNINKWWVYSVSIAMGILFSFMLFYLLPYFSFESFLLRKTFHYVENGITFWEFITLFGKIQLLSVFILIFIYSTLNRSMLNDFKLRFLFCLFISSLTLAFSLSSIEVAYRLLVVPFIIYPLLLIPPLFKKRSLIYIPFTLYLFVQLFFFVTNTNYIFRPFY